METPSHWKLMFPSDYIGAHDLRGKDYTVTISAVALEDLIMQGGKREQKPVVSFEGAKKRLVLNKTNAGTIAGLHGKRPAEWIGKKITLFPTTTKFGRETVECIRIRS